MALGDSLAAASGFFWVRLRRLHSAMSDISQFQDRAGAGGFLASSLRCGKVVLRKTVCKQYLIDLLALFAAATAERHGADEYRGNSGDAKAALRCNKVVSSF